MKWLLEAALNTDRLKPQQNDFAVFGVLKLLFSVIQSVSKLKQQCKQRVGGGLE
jgi:hypothetical protein